MTDTTRRDFLMTSACLICVVATGCGKDDDGTLDAGNVDDYANGVLTYIGDGVAVGKDEGGLYAMSTICTNKGCDIGEDGELTQDLITCGCCSSQYGQDGGIITGPAQDELNFYEMSFGEFGQVTVHTNRDTDASTRFEPEDE